MSRMRLIHGLYAIERSPHCSGAHQSDDHGGKKNDQSDDDNHSAPSFWRQTSITKLH